jgi:GH24 family phage-related lysozyme (muramidase)
LKEAELKMFEIRGCKDAKIELLEESGYKLTDFMKELIYSEDFLIITYLDHLGNKTTGVGRLLNKDSNIKKISIDEAIKWLRKDIKQAEKDCKIIFPNWQILPEKVRFALMEMAFNMGYNRLSKFPSMIKAITRKDYHKAAMEAFDSRWCFQVGRERATKIIWNIYNGGN